MKVYFIGAGPGAADLITVRGARILSESTLVLYAGSLVPEVVLSHCPPSAEKVNTASLNIEEQIKYYIRAKQEDRSVARVHSGDPSIYGAIAEQIKRLNELEIDFEIVPGVSSFAASAAALKAELTKPEVTQTVILTRVSGRASQVPELEGLSSLASHRASLCIFLSGKRIGETIDELAKHYDPQTPVALVHKVSWPEEKILRSTIGRIKTDIELDDTDWSLTTLIMVGEALSSELHAESRLYSPSYAHRFRKAIADTTEEGHLTFGGDATEPQGAVKAK